MTISVEHERAIIIGMIMWPQPGPAIVCSARCNRGFVEGIDQGARFDREGDVKSFTDLFIVAKPEKRLLVLAITAGGSAAISNIAAHFGNHGDAYRRERGIVKRFGLACIGNGYSDMIEHKISPLFTYMLLPLTGFGSSVRASTPSRQLTLIAAI
ncbi:MAG: hypothetical protein H0W93_05550 [Gammaproteobacteria bacterium]|nr:hypothetical protein [Gammaproteobacteria bacterium]